MHCLGFRTSFYEEGEKTGRLLARQLKMQNTSNVIPAFKKGNKMVTSSKKRNNVSMFSEYLYTVQSCSASPIDMDTFLSGIELPRLSDSKVEDLDCTIK
jgi:hypothetical protein